MENLNKVSNVKEVYYSYYKESYDKLIKIEGTYNTETKTIKVYEAKTEEEIIKDIEKEIEEKEINGKVILTNDNFTNYSNLINDSINLIMKNFDKFLDKKEMIKLYNEIFNKYEKSINKTDKIVILTRK